MDRYLPWYYKASRLRLMVYGALAAILGSTISGFAIDPNAELLRFSILFNEQEWSGVRPYAVLGEIIGQAAVGAMFGVWAYWWLRKKHRDGQQPEE